MTHRSAQTAFMGILAIIALFTALRAGQAIFAPMLSGLVLGVVCAPLANGMARIGIPRALAALFVLALFTLLAVSLFLVIEPTASRAIRNAPEIWRELTDILEAIRRAVAGVEQLQDSVQEALNEQEGDLAPAMVEADAPPAEEEAPVVIPGVMDALAVAPSVGAALLVFAGSFYFFLISRESLYSRIEKGLMPWSAKMLARAEAQVSRYFLTITLINATFGVLVGLAMMLISMPDPVLWGMAAFLINFILYLGPAVLAASLLIAGIVVFEGAYSVLPAATYVLLNMTEGQFVTPSLVGQHMKVNPLLVFISLVFWLWLWGPIGGIVAIPVLVWTLYLLGRIGWEGERPNLSRRRTTAAPGAPRH